MTGFSDTRRNFLRIVAPAVAMPMVATAAQAKEVRLVSQDEIMEAFRLYDHMELAAEDLNLRYQLLIEMLFETNPEKLREKLQVLRDNRKKRDVLVDVNTGQTAPFDPAMYNELGQLKAPVPRELPPRQVVVPDGHDPKLYGVTVPHSVKNKWRRRLVKALRKQVLGV